jgi:RES domain-containing protein
MIIYRLATENFKNDLSGTGSKLFGGRWNSKGIAALYTTENISLAILEILVNTEKNSIPPTYHLLQLTLPDSLIPSIIAKDKLKINWKDDFEYSQWMGTAFLKQKESLLLKVPSAVVDEENNYIFNPLHNDFKKLKIADIKKFEFDNRLYLKNE